MKRTSSAAALPFLLSILVLVAGHPTAQAAARRSTTGFDSKGRRDE